jgi:hypothetical protein
VTAGVGPEAVAAALAGLMVTLPVPVIDGVGPLALATAASGSMMRSALNVPPAAFATAAAGTVTVVLEPAETVGVGPLAVAGQEAGATSIETWVRLAVAVALAAFGSAW